MNARRRSRRVSCAACCLAFFVLPCSFVEAQIVLPDFNPPLPDVFPFPEFIPDVFPLPDFEPEPPPPHAPFIRGDALPDGRVDFADFYTMIAAAYFDGPIPSCLKTLDVNDDGTLNLSVFPPPALNVPPPPSDAFFLASHLFGLAVPPQPFPDIGEDPTDDDLSCEEFSLTSPPSPNARYAMNWTAIPAARGERVSTFLLASTAEAIGGFSLAYRYDHRILTEVSVDFESTIVPPAFLPLVESPVVFSGVTESADPNRYNLLVVSVIFAQPDGQQLVRIPFDATQGPLNQRPLLRVSGDIRPDAPTGLQELMKPATAADLALIGWSNLFVTLAGRAEDPGTKSASFALVNGGAEFLYHRGDFNNDGSLDLTDAVASFDHLFLGRGRDFCFEQADSNGDGSFDISDGVHSLDFLFTGGDRPAWEHIWTCVQGDFLMAVRASSGPCGQDGSYRCVLETEITIVEFEG